MPARHRAVALAKSRRSAWRRLLAWLVGIIVVGSLPACAYLDTKQRELIFRPVKAERPGYQQQTDGVESIWLPVVRAGKPTGDRLHAWWWPHSDPNAPSLLYLHGTRFNLSGSAFRIARLRSMGFNVLAVDYRGFGQSSGDLPSEHWAYEDASIAWAHLVEREPDPRRRFVYGHSLGGAVAVDLATRTDGIAGVIIESTFTTMRDMADTTIARYLPVSWILTQRFDVLSKMPKVRAPLLIVHGTGDRYVPYQMSERLFAAAPDPKRLLLVDNATHSNTAWIGFDVYAQAVAAMTLGGRAPVAPTAAITPASITPASDTRDLGSAGTSRGTP